MNTIFTFEQHTSFDEETQNSIDKISFSQIPEMKITERNAGTEEDPIALFKIPFQADISEIDFDSLKLFLEAFGLVDIIGKWNDDGSLIKYSITKYRNTLKPLRVFENAVFLNGEDFTGREDEFISVQKKDENDELMFNDLGEPIYLIPTRKTFIREKASTTPTLSEAKLINVNVFNNKFIRQLP